MRRGLAVWLIAAVALLAGLWLLFGRGLFDRRGRDFIAWAGADPAAHAALVTVQREACPGAPFILPADGWIGLLYGDARGPYSPLRRHQGIDIFVERDRSLGTQPVYAVADGYITREQGWVSTVIQRIPDNPLNPGEQIWVYYTHMADTAGNDYIAEPFARGTRERFVPQGTLLGYVGDYDGNVPSRIWPHLHLSIVRDDGQGSYLNEYYIENTLDPSPFFGIAMNAADAPAGSARCLEPVE